MLRIIDLERMKNLRVFVTILNDFSKMMSIMASLRPSKNVKAEFQCRKQDAEILQDKVTMTSSMKV